MIKILLVIATISALLLLGIWCISVKDRLEAKEKKFQKTMKEINDFYETVENLTPAERFERRVEIQEASWVLFKNNRKAARLASQIQKLRAKLE